MSSAWMPPPLFDAVPADTPYIAAQFAPPPRAFSADILGDDLKKLDELLDRGDLRGDEALGRAMRVLRSEIRAGGDRWPEQLGLDPSRQFVLYGLSIWPVLRIALAQPQRTRDVLARMMTATGAMESAVFQGRAYWRGGNAHVVVVAAVVDHEVMFAALPTPLVQRALPYVLGLARPARTLRAAPLLPALLARYRLSASLLVVIDLERVLEGITGSGHGQHDELTAVLAGVLSPVCHDDAARLIAAAPRWVLGYHRFDETGFAGTFAIEAPARVTSSLARLRVTMPPLGVHTSALATVAAAVDVDGMLVWLRDLAQGVRAEPFKCPALAKLNDAAGSLLDTLDHPMPPLFRGLRGFEIVMDDVTASPFSASGHVLVAGDHVGSLIRQLARGLPMFASLPLAIDGTPVPLPIDQLGGAGLMPAHLAMHEDRAVLALGADSARRAVTRLAAPMQRAPLLTFLFDTTRLRERLGPLLPESLTQGWGTTRSSAITLDVDRRGLVFEMMGTWQGGAARPAPDSIGDHGR